MATTKTLTATNVTMSIPEMSDAPNASVFSTDVGALGDAANYNTGKVNALGSSLAIVSTGNTHAAIASGQYVYIKDHGTLSDGLYTANAAISANATLTSSNVTAVSSGGLNALNSNIATLEGKYFGTLAGTTNFNDVTTNGIYALNWISNGTSYNRPSNSGGILVVSTVATASYQQIYITYASPMLIHTRIKTDDGWSDWQRVANYSDIKFKSVVYYTGTLENGNLTIPTATFNPSTEVGFAMCATGARWLQAQTISGGNLICRFCFYDGSVASGDATVMIAKGAL